MKRFYIILLCLLFASCEEYFTPDIDEQEPQYAFECLITNQPDVYKLSITKTSGYGSSNKIEIVTDAKAKIITSDSAIYPLLYNSTNGCYCSNPDKFIGQIGKSYQLQVTTADGKTFKSDVVEMLDCPDIEFVNAQYYYKKKLVTTGAGYIEEGEDGILVNNTTYAQGYTPYYRYECKLLLQSRQHYPEAIPIERYIYRPISGYGNLYLANANDYVDNKIIENKLCNTAYISLNYQDPYILPEKEFSVRNIGEFVSVKQYSLNEKEFLFWEAIKDQQTNTNYLFGQIENQPVSNIKGVNGEKALGYFCVSAVKEKLRAFSLSLRNREVRPFSVPYFPDLDSVTIYDAQPDFYISFTN